jgi:hypothetical protein
VKMNKFGIAVIFALMLLVPGVVTFALMNSAKKTPKVGLLITPQSATPEPQQDHTPGHVTPVTQEEGVSTLSELEQVQAAARIRRQAGEVINQDGHYDISGDNFANFEQETYTSQAASATIGKYSNDVDLVFLDPRFFGDQVAAKYLSGNVMVRGDSKDFGTIVLAHFSDDTADPLTFASEEEKLERAIRVINSNKFSGEFKAVAAVTIGSLVQAGSFSFAEKTLPMYTTTGYTQDGDCITEYVILTDVTTIHIAKISVGTAVQSCPVSRLNERFLVVSKAAHEQYLRSK